MINSNQINVMKKRLLDFLFPIRKIIIFESNPDFADNTYWLFKYIADNNLFSDYKFVWVTAKPTQIRMLCGRNIICVDRFDKSYKGKLRRLYYLRSAKVIINCNRTIFKTRKEQIRIYLGHGMPIKQVKQLFDNKARGECDLLPLLGEKFREMYENFGYKEELNVCGYPRNEVLCKLSPSADDRYVVMMPTYREHISKDFVFSGYHSGFPLGIPAIKSYEEFKWLDDLLVCNKIKLYIRLHPAQDSSRLKLDDFNNIIIADDEFLKSKNISLYEFVAMSSALITDYSSIYYDYLLTKRPIGLTLEDAEQYALKFGLHFDDIRKELSGFKIDNCKDLAKFIEQIADNVDLLFDEREHFRREYGIEEFSSCRLIIDFLQRKLSKV